MTSDATAKTLVPVLGDQLSPGLSSLRGADKANAVVLLAEVQAEATYVRHHKKKIALIFAAMRHFAEELRASGWTVDYVRLDADENTHDIRGEVARAVKRHGCGRVLATEAAEFRLLDDMQGWADRLGVPVEILDDERFLCTRAAFADWASGRKQLRMETFYREMRRKTGLLMDGDEPAGGKWNFDHDNRKPADADLFMPTPPRFEPDDTTCAVLDLVKTRFDTHFGDLEPFWFAVTHDQAEQALDHFIAEALPCFGDYQDAMLRGERFLYHSVLSGYLNCGLLDPLEVCRRAEAAYQAGDAPINAVEGFIRQIIGWREYMRGIYWLTAPDYVERNALGADRNLPDFYWTGKTDMRCLREAITQTKEDAYAHHIQRLMVTGNFAMLIGVAPQQIHEWYLAVYVDAYEWVELPNTLGMSQFADGGLLSSKPYAASGAYINRMSDYCQGCDYKVSVKTGKEACPFNHLYWDFLARNVDVLRGNPRLNQVYATWDRMDGAKKNSYRESARAFLDRLGKG